MNTVYHNGWTRERLRAYFENDDIMNGCELYNGIHNYMYKMKNGDIYECNVKFLKDGREYPRISRFYMNGVLVQETTEY